MDIKKYNFKAPSMCLRTDKKLLNEAEARGFCSADTEYHTEFRKLFFDGGKINISPDVDKAFISAALPYFKAFAASFEPKHEEKEAICALLLSEFAGDGK